MNTDLPLSPSREHGRVIWITGLSGSGKTTTAFELLELFRKQGESWVHVDGDQVREMFGHDLGHDPQDRLKNAYRIARLSHWLAHQGQNVVTSTVSLFGEIHEWNRKNIPKYFEVYLEASVEQVASRDPKGLYARSSPSLVGVDLKYDVPLAAHLRIDQAKVHSAGEAAGIIFAEWRKKFL